MAKTNEFIKACLEGRLAEAKSLLAEADVNGANELGQCALLTFDAEVTRFLLENGADPNRQTNENGPSPLSGLCFDRKYDCVKLLLSKGADPNVGRPESGETPLHHAVCGKDPNNVQLQIVTALLEAGANPNRRAKSGIISDNFMRDVRVRGEAPLHRAAAYASKEVIEVLLAAGADRSTRLRISVSFSRWLCTGLPRLLRFVLRIANLYRRLPPLA
ncbi:MAG: ankyrin repeat domain-containing protein [Gemmataceae bacterium]